jgi:hypothetical protein
MSRRKWPSRFPLQRLATKQKLKRKRKRRAFEKIKTANFKIQGLVPHICSLCDDKQGGEEDDADECMIARRDPTASLFFH